jgi:hypothetical protein
VNDLWEYSRERLESIQIPGNVHFTETGSKALAAEVARAISAQSSQ